MPDKYGKPNHLMDYLAHLHQGGWYGFRKTDDDGNPLPKGTRNTYPNLIIHPELWSNEKQIMEPNPHSKPTEQECIDGLAALAQAYDDDIDKRATDKASATTKLKALGLTDDEIVAISRR